VNELTDLAHAAVTQGDPIKAAAVHNQAALIASDTGIPDLARTWCHRHARLHLAHTPLDCPAARRALEPLVNLARLRIRAGHGEAAYRLLTRLYTAVTTHTDTTIDGTDLPAALTATEEDHQEVCQWLWSITLADTARALTSAGRWNDALTHMRDHHGIGHRLLDGRQIAIIAALTTDHPDHALALLDDCTPIDAWEHAISGCFALHSGSDPAAAHLTQHYEQVPLRPEIAVFRTRLGLAILDAEHTDHLSIDAFTAQLIQRTLDTCDGYAVQDLISEPRCTAHMTSKQTAAADAFVEDCRLGSGRLPAIAHDALIKALDMTATVLHATTRTRSRIRQ
jgi:hypothetical protein